MIELLLQSTILAPYRNGLATDFKSVLISTSKISPNDMTIEVQYRSEGEATPLANAITYTVTVNFDRTLSVSGLMDYLKSPDLSHSFVDKTELITALNIFFNHYAKAAKNITAFGSEKGSRSFPHNPAGGPQRLDSCLDALRGYFSSVRPATCRLLVNVNVINGAFYPSGPLTALMSSHGVGNIVALERFLKYLRVQTTHRPVKRNISGEAIPRVKSILSLARPGDGHTMDHPPKIKKRGANAEEVEFWLKDQPSQTGEKGGLKVKGKDKTNSQDVSGSKSGRYVTVLDFSSQVRSSFAPPDQSHHWP